MKFHCNSADFIEALSTATHALPARTTIPALENVLVETDENDNIVLTCSDQSLTIITRLQAEIDEGGSVLLPGKLLAELSRKLPEGELNVSSSESGHIVFRCCGSRTQLAAKPANTYPRIEQINENEQDSSITLPQSVLKDMILKTSFAIATDEERPILTGCLLDVKDGEARMVALDGFRMAVRMQRVGEDAAVHAVIPGKALQEIARILSDSDEDMITVATFRNRMYTRIDNTEIYTILKEGEYINYRQITPQSFRMKADVESAEFSRCVERASLMAREGKNNLVKLDVGDGRIVVTSNSEIGDIYEEIPAETDGENLKIAFNVKYLSDALRALDGRRIQMRFISGVNPCVIVPSEGDDFLHLILPVRMNA